MKFLLAFSSLLAVGFAASNQVPGVWTALDRLRGRAPLTVPEQQNIYENAVEGKDFPLNWQIPQPIGIAGKPPGFYADMPTGCQGFHRVNLEGEITSYLCPNQTLFNQITLICDWFWNIDCKNSKQFESYSNSRLLEENSVLLDNEDSYVIKTATGAA